MPQQPQSPSSSNRPTQGHGKLEDLVDNLRVVENTSDDPIELLAQNWQQVLGGIAVVLIFVWIFHRYQDSQHMKFGEASARFSEVQKAFTTLGAAPSSPAAPAAGATQTAEPENKSKIAFQDNIRALDDSFGGSFYDQTGDLYAAREALNRGDTAAAVAILEPLSEKRFVSLPSASQNLRKDPNLLVAEMASLMLARARLQSDDKTLRTGARDMLRNLALGGRVAAVEAAFAYKNSAADAAERAEAQQFFTELQSSRPELAEQLTRDASPMMAPPMMNSAELAGE